MNIYIHDRMGSGVSCIFILAYFIICEIRLLQVPPAVVPSYCMAWCGVAWWQGVGGISWQIAPDGTAPADCSVATETSAFKVA